MRDLFGYIGIAAVAFLIGKELFPRKIDADPVIPTIETKYDTVRSVPEWFEDSLNYWRNRKPTRDTTEIVITNTVIDTVLVDIPCEAEKRPQLWPVLAYTGGSEFGDTATVTTFSLQTGQGSVSKVFIPGILTSLVADSTGIPRLVYDPFPKPKGPSLFYRLKLVGLGALGGFAACGVM